MKQIKKWYDIAYNYINFYLKKKEAIRLHLTTGKQYHVCPAVGNKLIILDNTFLKFHNANIKGKGRRLTFPDLLKMSYFSTPAEGITRNINTK